MSEGEREAIAPVDRKLALAEWLEKAPRNIIGFGTGEKEVIRPDYLLVDDVDWIIEQCRAFAARPASNEVLDQAVAALFDGGFIDAGSRLTVDGTKNTPQSEWACELERRLKPIRAALAAEPASNEVRLQVIEECAQIAEKYWAREVASQIRALAAEPGESKPAPLRPGWPTKGDWMKFLGKNGYDHQRTEALQKFVVGKKYLVEDCDVQSWSHSIKFDGIDGRYNGVMFERCEPGESKGGAA